MPVIQDHRVYILVVSLLLRRALQPVQTLKVEIVDRFTEKSF